MKAYADTSFLVSLYTPDTNSCAAAAQMKRSRAVVVVTPLGELELLNALELRIFRGELTREEVEAAAVALREDIHKGVYDLTSFPRAAFDRAKEIAGRQTARLGTRTLDILHVAAALVAQADVFYSYDRNQLRLARAEGLKVP